MTVVFDTLTVLLWAVTYFIIVWQVIRYRKEPPELYIPLLPCSLNFAWELNAVLVSGGDWGHVLWLGLDLVIFFSAMRYLRKPREGTLFAAWTVCLIVFFRWLFRVPNFQGQLMSSFVMDLLTAILFLVYAKRISPHGKISVAAAKLFGDLFAWIAYAGQSRFVLIAGAAVQICNLLYLAVCLEEQSQRIKGSGKRHRPK